MKAYKAFSPGLVCRGYHYDRNNINIHDRKSANCVQDGFHCAENPLDCFTYYPDITKAEYALVDAGGDIDEDGRDSKIACTHMKIIKVFTPEEFLIECLIYQSRHGYTDSRIAVDEGDATVRGYAFAVGNNPRLSGKLGDYLVFGGTVGGFLRTCLVIRIDGVNFQPNTKYSLSQLLIMSERKQAERPAKPMSRCGDCELFDRECNEFVSEDETFSDSDDGCCPAFKPKEGKQ